MKGSANPVLPLVNAPPHPPSLTRWHLLPQGEKEGSETLTPHEALSQASFRVGQPALVVA
jgi:hypothetical protein